MQNPNFRNILIVVAVVLLVVIVSRNRGAQQQVAQPDPQQIAQQVGQQVGAEIAKQVEQVAQVVATSIPSQASRFADARDELKSAGFQAVGLPSEPVCSGLPFGYTENVIGYPDYILVIKYSADAAQSNPADFGCEYLILDIPPGSGVGISALNPLDCIVVSGKPYSPITITFAAGKTFPVAVFQPLAFMPNGWKFNFEGGAYCVNGAGTPKG